PNTNISEQRIIQLEQQVLTLTNNIKTLQEGKSQVDNTIADLHHNHKKIAQSQDRSIKTPKRPSPYDQTSYRTTKSKYNLRGNKQGRASADDSEPPIATDNDTDAPDDAVMSDGAIFEGIIDELSNTTSTETKFSIHILKIFFMEHTNLKLPAGLENQPFEPNIQYSYSKFNKNTKKQKNYNKPQNHKNINQYFQTPHNNDIYTLHSRNYIQEPHNEEDENMLNYIEHNIFNDNDTTEMAVSEDLFNTDHKALSCYLMQDYFKNKSNSARKSLEKSPTYKPNTKPQIHYKYSSMTTESWSNYKLTNGIIYQQQLNNMTSSNKTPEQQIEFFWSNIKEIINQAKEKCIPFSTHKKYTKHDRSLYLRQNNNKILTLHTILRKFSNIKINRIQQDHDKWKDYWKS
ncbi:12848_t:CDS:2, partial [Rhizophagus irregularis]